MARKQKKADRKSAAAVEATAIRTIESGRTFTVLDGGSIYCPWWSTPDKAREWAEDAEDAADALFRLQPEPVAHPRHAAERAVYAAKKRIQALERRADEVRAEIARLHLDEMIASCPALRVSRCPQNTAADLASQANAERAAYAERVHREFRIEALTNEAIVIEKEIADVDPARAGAMAEREAKYALEQHAAIARFARQDAAALRNAARFARSRAGVKERYNSERPVRALPALTYRLSESATVDVDDLIRFLREVA